MAISANMKRYQESLVDELHSMKERVRNLIGSSHWPSDGAHKEAILKSMLKRVLPVTLDVTSGFVVTQDGKSTGQLDILIVDATKPRLFCSGDLSIVTADCVKGIIEVKTNAIPGKLEEWLTKLADDAALIRKAKEAGCPIRTVIHCPGDEPSLESLTVGLFAYDVQGRANSLDLKALESLNLSAKGKMNRVINMLALGHEHFCMFWPSWRVMNSDNARGKDDWIIYSGMEKLTQAYFISNIVDFVSGLPSSSRGMWFPITEGKDRYARKRIGLMNNSVESL